MKVGKAEGYVLLTILFLFQPVIERYFALFKYFDETIVLIFFLRYLFSIIVKKGHINFFARIIGLGLIILIVIGLIGNYRSSVHQPLIAIIQDIFSNCKIFLFFMSMQIVHFSDYQKVKYKEEMNVIIRLLFMIVFVCAIISLVIDIGMTDYTEGTRYGIKAFQFIFNNPAGLNTYFYLFMIIYSITLYKNGVIRKYSTVYTIMGVIGWVLTLRSRAIAFAFIYLCIYGYVVYYKRVEKIRFTLGKVVLAAVGSGILCWDAIEKYFILNDRVSRYQLLYWSGEIAKRYFPIGTGFGTFGTEASRNYYSPIYYHFHMSNVYGLSPNNPLFILDQYWFGILGQFGFIGLVLVGFMVLLSYRDVWKISKYDKGNQLAALTLFYTSIFASLTAGTFVQASILPSILVFYILKLNGCGKT